MQLPSILSPAGRDEQHANIVLDIRNVGTDTATDVSVEYSVSAHNIVGQTTHFVSMLPKAVGRLSIPVPLQQRGVNTQIHLKYEYRDIFKETDKEYQQYVKKGQSEYRVCMKKDMVDDEDVKWMFMLGEYYRGHRDQAQNTTDET